MVKSSRRNKIFIAAIAVLAVVLAVSVPYISAQAVADNAASNIRTLNAHGYIYQKIDTDTIKYYSADLTLTVQPTGTNGTVKLFDVTGGSLMTNGITYTLTSGNGALLTRRHAVLLQAQGTDGSGQAATLKLAGQYGYSWTTRHVTLKIGAKLQTSGSNYTLLMQAPI
jgi:hypothetical protein